MENNELETTVDELEQEVLEMVYMIVGDFGVMKDYIENLQTIVKHKLVIE